MTYVKFNTLDDSDALAELINALFDRDYEHVPIIGKTDKNYLVAGVALIDGDNFVKLYHKNVTEFGNIVEWAFVENPTVVADDGREHETAQN